MNSYSYSMLSAAYRCNRYFRLVYVDKLKPTAITKSADLVYGSSIHFALENYLKDGDDPVESFKAYWAPEAANLEYGRHIQGCLESNAETLLSRFVRLHAKKFKVHQMEERLYGTIREGSTVRLEGTPDLLGEYEGTPSVVDFKTSGYRYPKEKIFLNEQMFLYAHLARQAGYNVKQLVYYVFIKGNTPSIQTLALPLEDDYLKKVLANIEIQCDNLDKLRESGQWSYNSNSCQMGERKCDYFEHCWKTK